MAQFSDFHLNTKSKGLFVTAIGTDSGKTLASAILLRHFKAIYWKPVQCGGPTDSEWIKTILGPKQAIIPEQFFFQTPASPHFAAAKEGKYVSVNDFYWPENLDFLVTEGAGGLMVPLNEKEVLADLIAHFQVPLVLVVNHYLGALNHTLLSLAEIKRRKLDLAGIIFNGEDFQDAESVILNHAGARCWLRIPRLDEINLFEIDRLALKLKA